MRRNSPPRVQSGIFQARFIIPIAFMLVGVIVGVGFMSRGRGNGTEPVVVVPDTPPAPIVAEPFTEDQVVEMGEPVIPPVPPANDPFANGAERVGRYKAGTSALRQSVERYAASRENQCSGEVSVKTEATALNIRSGPATTHPVVAKAPRNSTQQVLLWAPEEGSQSGRWFLLVDEQKKTIKGWVSGEFCDSTNVVFPD